MRSSQLDAWKLIMTYNIRPDQQQEYYKYMIGRYVPVVQSLGLEMTDAYHTAYGPYPNRLIVFVARTRVDLDTLLANEVWHQLNEQLFEYVTDFTFKVAPFKQEFQF